MTKEDIIRMAMESGITKVMDESSYRWLLEGREPINEVFIKFANLVAAAEREACAALCFQMWNEWLVSKDRQLDGFNRPDAEDCAHAIRARGQE